MAPKRWANPNQRSSPSENAYTTGELLNFICNEIRNNNVLSLPEEEMMGMAKELLNVKTRGEVTEWAGTLMLSDVFVTEVIKRREQSGPAFEGEGVPGKPADTVASTAAGGSPHVAKRGNAAVKRSKRGVNSSFLGPTNAAADALKPGQFECGCFATVHNLRGSCANCGRIICEQEADDVCYACGMDPSRCIAYEISVQEGNVSEAAQHLNQADYATAVERRDLLLDYAQNRAKRTTVIDDQSATLFAPQSAWISPDERKVAEKSAAEMDRERNIELMHRQRGAYQVHLNFVNQNLSLGARQENTGGATTATVAEEDGAEEVSEVEGGAAVLGGAEPLPSLLQKIWYSPDGTLVETARGMGKGFAVTISGGGVADVNLPSQDGAAVPLTSQRTQRHYEEVSRRVQQNYFEDDVEVFSEEASEKARSKLMCAPPIGTDAGDGVMDEEEDTAVRDAAAGSSAKSSAPAAPLSRFRVTIGMRNIDEGVCLSMHQPWASLLVAGIKQHEGRVWETSYRGRLWIHAASAPPANVAEVEAQYAPFMAPGQHFPQHYPTKVLVGYVYVTDCLDREAYEAAFEPLKRQEDSPYSLICVEPKVLPFPLPMAGNHKLFSLEHKVHVAAKKQLGEVP